MNEAPIEEVTVTIRGKEIRLDPKIMKFNENSLSQYMDREYGWIDYLGKQLEFATKEFADAEIEYERIYSATYIVAKDSGKGTEAYAKACALSDAKVVAARKNVADRKETVGLLKAHLKAWDKNHDNAQNRGHTLRKELDKLNRDIYKPAEDEGSVETASAEDFLKELK